jgi:hypothetical protein
MEENKRHIRGLSSASAETRLRVAKLGGDARHVKRGLQAADPETRLRVARKGGLVRGAQRRHGREKKATVGAIN